MSKFNFLTPAPTELPKVRIRATGRDQYASLRGREYIEARQLNQPAKRVQTSALLTKPD